MILTPSPKQQFFGNNGRPLDGGLLFTYAAGTNNKIDTYSNASGTLNTNPIVLDFRGEANIWLDPEQTYKFVLSPRGDTDPPTNPIWSVDDIRPGITLADITQQFLGQILWPRTQAEIDAGVTPVDYAIQSHDACEGVIPNRYQTNTSPGITDMTAAFTAAKSVSEKSGGAPILLLAQTYLATVSLRFDNAGIIGPGSANCTVKHPPGALAVGGVIEVGDTASGNSAASYNKFVARGFTIDGNRANTTAPTDDLKGHGLVLTKISYWHISDVRVINCHNAGVIPVINSNYGYVDCTVENCGNATHTNPGFDINSSKYITGAVVSKDCYVGARVLDNCWGLILSVTVHNATSHGAIYQNQPANESHTNNLTFTINTTGDHGLVVQENVRGGIINASIIDAANVGCNIPDGSVAANRVSGLILNLTTRSSGAQGLLCHANDCRIVHRSYLDGRNGAQGSSYACDVHGDRNTLDVDVQDSDPWQVRGVAIRANATKNRLASLTWTNTADPYSDAGTDTTFLREGRGDNVASGASLTLPVFGSVFHITGTTNITSISASSCNNRTITLIFDGILTVTDGSNLKLAGDFVTSTDDTITLWCDGTNWFEICRSVN
jgi:hypothetical protein